jgi:small subunit ribosomal protein S17|tara:strand:+ start:1384 stop:1644 length:261 start_codon:yes stop_codon:yes gene_type:complete
MVVKEKIGVVISTKMNKTAVVNVESRYSHPIYSKIMIKTKKYLVHDELEECNAGDKVLIQESRPLSKKKRWRFVNIVTQSSLVNEK